MTNKQSNAVAFVPYEEDSEEVDDNGADEGDVVEVLDKVGVRHVDDSEMDVDVVDHVLDFLFVSIQVVVAVVIHADADVAVDHVDIHEEDNRNTQEEVEGKVGMDHEDQVGEDTCVDRDG